MYSNGQTELKTESEVFTENGRQNETIKNNLDRILHYERYRNNGSKQNSNNSFHKIIPYSSCIRH